MKRGPRGPSPGRSLHTCGGAGGPLRSRCQRRMRKIPNIARIVPTGMQPDMAHDLPADPGRTACPIALPANNPCGRRAKGRVRGTPAEDPGALWGGPKTFFPQKGIRPPLTKLLLYAQPAEAGPFISKVAIRKGSYKEGGGALGGLSLTDVGKAVWESMGKIYSDFEIDAIEIALGPAPWALRFTTSQFRLVLTRRAYKSFEGASGSYITLDFDGDKHAVFRFLKTFLKTLRRPPWEMVFPPEFREKTGLKVKEIAEPWEKFARGIALGDEEEDGEDDAPDAAGERLRPPPAPAVNQVRAVPRLELSAGSFLGFDGDGLVMNVRVENASEVSLEKLQVAPKSSLETLQFGAPAKVISFLKPRESLNLAFPLAPAAEESAGEVWAEIEGTGSGQTVAARTAPRKLKAVLPKLLPAEVTTAAWHQKASALVRRDEVRSKVYMAASEAFDEMLTRVKTAGLALLDPEVIRAGSNYMGHLKLFAEDARKRPYAFALDCVGDFQQSKITLHFYAESAELVMALRGRMLSALAGKG